jgi:hypothetical protein
MSKTAALRIPILPHTAEAAPQPPTLKLPLRQHQLRALNRCLCIEQDGDLSKDFGESLYKYTSRGGCLADEVGVGKTATMIGLVLTGLMEDDGNIGGDTLVVAPKHLIPQWMQEIHKFTDAIEVVVGKKGYEAKCSCPAVGGKRRIVLVDVDSILNEDKLWYDFRRVFTSENGPRVHVDAPTMQRYRTAANFCVKSPKGGCSYDGWVYLSSLHLPQRPWRRVIFDEIQDLVADGKESQKNLLQLSRTATNVWLLSATPFPHGNSSVYANHELLGFCRLRMDVETDQPLPRSHTFERIKRKLYIRSPRHVADEAVTAKVTRQTTYVTSLDIEQQFYQLEQDRVHEDPNISPCTSLFAEPYRSLREMTVHPEASADLRQVMGQQQQVHHHGSYTRPVSKSVDMAAQEAVSTARSQLRQLKQRDPQKMEREQQAIARSISLAKKVKAFREITPLLTNVFAGAVGPEKILARKAKEARLIHDEYCVCQSPGEPGCFGQDRVEFRVIREEDSSFQPEFIRGPGSMVKLVQYFDVSLAEDRQVPCGSGYAPAIQNYVSVTQRTYNMRYKDIEAMAKQKKGLELRIKRLSSNSDSLKNQKQEVDDTARLHGSKPAALVSFLRTVVANGEKAIVFSYWHDTLKLVKQTLKKCSLESVFCEGNQMAEALEEFTTGSVPIILLSAQSKASGANLQCATHVILLDPAGSSAEHGSTLEEQAIGRAVRMGQERPVTVTRFCVKGTLEAALFREIDQAAAKKQEKARDTTYAIEGFHKTAPKVEQKPAVEKDNDIEVTDSLTQEERLQRSFQEAEAKGDVVVMLDLDDEDDDASSKKTPVTKALTAKAISPGSGARVKQEPVSGKRTEIETDNPGPTPKRARRISRIAALETPDTSAVASTPSPTSTRATVTPLLTREVSMEDSPETFAANRRKEAIRRWVEDGETANMREASIRKLLGGFDLLEYAEKFVETGYDHSISWLYKMAEDVDAMEKLAETVGFKPGHAIRFQTNLAKEAAKVAKEGPQTQEIKKRTVEI